MPKRFFLLVLIMGFGYSVLQAEKNNEGILPLKATLKTDFVSRHLWRGIINNSSPSVQPTMEVSIHSLTLGVWGSYSLGKERLQEIDLYAGFEHNGFSIALYDYFNPVDTLGWEGDFFNYSGSTTRHTLEAIASYSGSKHFPLKFTTAVMLYGDDKNRLTRKNLYSTYFELGYTFHINGSRLIPHFGFTPHKSYYAEHADIVNVGFSMHKEIALNSRFSLPVRCTFSVNPNKNTAYLVLGLTLQ